MTGGSSEPLLRARDVAEMTGVSVSTLQAWAARRDAGLPGPGPVHVRLSGRHRRWRRDDVLAWIDESRVAG